MSKHFGPDYVRAIAPYQAGKPIAEVAREFGLDEANIVKLASKEDFAPRTAATSIFIIAPVIALFTAIATIAIIPFGDTRTDGLFGADYGLYGIDVSIGVLYAFAFGSIAFYGLMLGGWASGSKYSFLGAMRSAAQLISYELAAGLSLVGVVMMAGTLSLTEIVNEQDEIWFIIPQFVGFLIFLIASFAETNRAPFDLVLANILANPLRQLAGPMARHLAPSALVISAKRGKPGAERAERRWADRTESVPAERAQGRHRSQRPAAAVRLRTRPRTDVAGSLRHRRDARRC